MMAALGPACAIPPEAISRHRRQIWAEMTDDGGDRGVIRLHPRAHLQLRRLLRVSGDERADQGILIWVGAGQMRASRRIGVHLD
jgi:hypothetical protein